MWYMRYSGPFNLHERDLLQIHTNGTDNIFLFSKVCALCDCALWILLFAFKSILKSNEASDKSVLMLITWSWRCCTSDWLNDLLFLAGSVRTSFGLLDSRWIAKTAELSLCKYYAWVQQSNRLVCPICHVRVKIICVCVQHLLFTHSMSLLTHFLCVCSLLS